MLRFPSAWDSLAAATMIVAATAMLAGCAKTPAPVVSSGIPTRFASAEQVEETFRGRSFILGDNATVALVRPVDSPKDQWLKLSFWFGFNLMVPGALQPKEGDYYIISEARLVKPLDAPGEWMIEAGSSLIKRETVLQTTRTHYLGGGKILPTIVQYQGMRDFKTEDGKPIQIPILREVSLPMKWTLGGGGVPASYARYRTG
jgi:hypothetical protein